MRNGIAVFILLVVAFAAGIGLRWASSRNAENAPLPASDASIQPVSDAVPVASSPVDLSNPVPEIRVTSAASAPAPIVVNEPAIRGRVIDEFDAPIEEAAVTVYDVATGPHRTFTDSAGAFAIGDLIAGGKYRVSAMKAHYNETVNESVVAGADDIVLMLTYTSTAVGRVVDELGRPVTRFELVYLKDVVDSDALWKEIVRSPATPWQPFEHPDGRYEIGNIGSSASFSLGARAQGFEAAVITAPAAPPGEQISLPDIVMKSDARIDGLVLSPQRMPVSGANVHLGPDAEGPIVGTTDGAGRFVLSGLGDAAVWLTADHDAYLPATIRVFPSRGETASVEIVFRQGGALVGRVTRGGQPAQGQTIIAMRLTELRVRKQTLTDANGRYRIDGLGTGLLDVLAKYALPGDGSSLRIQSQVEIVAGADATLNFDFPDALGTLEGMVTANGKPVAFAEIKGTIDTTQGQATFIIAAHPDGLYRIENLVPGDASVTVSGRSNDAELRRTVATELRGGEVTRLDVDFDEAASLSGRVTNLAAGEVGQVFALKGHESVDVSTAESILRLDAIKAGESDIDANGQFAISGLESGEYTLVALVFRQDAGTGDETIETIRVATGKTVLPESGDATVTLTLTSPAQ